LGGLKGSANLEIKLDLRPSHPQFKVRSPKGEKFKLPVYTANDDISGEIKVELKDTKKFEHLGIKCMLIGYLGTAAAIAEIFSDKNLSTEFHSLQKEL
jgi:hypothetical protein